MAASSIQSALVKSEKYNNKLNTSSIHSSVSTFALRRPFNEQCEHCPKLQLNYSRLSQAVGCTDRRLTFSTVELPVLWWSVNFLLQTKQQWHLRRFKKKKMVRTSPIMWISSGFHHYHSLCTFTYQLNLIHMMILPGSNSLAFIFSSPPQFAVLYTTSLRSPFGICELFKHQHSHLFVILVLFYFHFGKLFVESYTRLQLNAHSFTKYEFNWKWLVIVGWYIWDSLLSTMLGKKKYRLLSIHKLHMPWLRWVFRDD